MKQFDQQIQKKADAIKMRAVEKKILRERVVSYMEYHPLPASMKVETESSSFVKEIMAEPFWLFNFNTKYLQSGLVLGALLVLVGVPALAERSLPGDVLYGMKVGVTEEIRSTLAFSSYAKIEWEAERLERRLSEARLLSQAGRLTMEVEQEVADAVKKHSDTAHETIMALRETDSESATLAEIAFTSVLEAQDDILTLQGPVTLASSNTVEPPTTATTLALAVRDARTQAQLFDSSAVTPERLFALIERDTTYAQEVFDTISEDTSISETQSIQRRLADIGRKVENAQVKMAVLKEASISDPSENVNATAMALDSANTPSSTTELSIALSLPTEDLRTQETKAIIALLRTALTDTRKLISFMTDIEVRNSLTVDSLVPITLTDEERVLAVNAKLTEISTIQAEIKNRVIDSELLAKVEFGVSEAELKARQGDEALKSGSLAEAEALVAEAFALITDSRAMVGNSELKPVINEGILPTATSTDEVYGEDGGEEATSTPSV